MSMTKPAISQPLILFQRRIRRRAATIVSLFIIILFPLTKFYQAEPVAHADSIPARTRSRLTRSAVCG